jgi:hypothetical protein
MVLSPTLSGLALSVSWVRLASHLSGVMCTLSSLFLELHMTQASAGGLRVGYTDKGVEMVVHVALSSHMDAEKAAACGLDVEKLIVVSMTFSRPPEYLSGLPDCKTGTLIVRQVDPSVDLMGKDARLDFHSFGLWWTLEQLLSVHLKDIWPAITAAATLERPILVSKTEHDSLSSLLEMLDTPQTEECSLVNVAKACSALNRHKGSVVDALGHVEKVDDGLREIGSDSNVLLRCAEFVLQKLAIVTDHCLICNKKMTLQLYKPTICDSNLCEFSFLEFGLGVKYSLCLLMQSSCEFTLYFFLR